MAFRDGSVVAVNYTAKIAGSGEIFDTTLEKDAIDAGIFNKDVKYAPSTMVLGEGENFPKLDEEIKAMAVGESKKILLQPKDAFGERSPKLIAVVPLREFQQRKMMPFPGLVIDVNGQRGKVQSVSGGRVRVDFNHPLAGRELVYELKVEKELTQPKEQVEGLFEKYFGAIPEKEREVKVGAEEVEVQIASKYSRAVAPLKEHFSKLITKSVKGIKKVKFVEEFGEEKAAEGEGEKKKQ